MTMSDGESELLGNNDRIMKSPPFKVFAWRPSTPASPTTTHVLDQSWKRSHTELREEAIPLM
jgi:hypothetical protein